MHAKVQVLGGAGSNAGEDAMQSRQLVVADLPAAVCVRNA